MLDGKEREEYEQLNCNLVKQGLNPSCDAAWGDLQINSWKHNPVPQLCRDGDAADMDKDKDTGGDAKNDETEKLRGKKKRSKGRERGSEVKCFDSQSQARFCVFENVMVSELKLSWVVLCVFYNCYFKCER